MSLPTINVPTYELEIPSNKEKITYRPFLVKEEKILLLANESQDEDEMINAIKQIITNCTFGKLEVENFAIFDLEFITTVSIFSIPLIVILHNFFSIS